MNRLKAVASEGQSLWLDFIDRDLLASGSFERLIHDDGITGLTSNPAIFEKAIASTSQYDGALKALLAEEDAEPEALFERLAIPDIQRAADLLMPTYVGSGAKDGYVSFEVAPHLCADTEATVFEARRLWAAIERRNLMIKVPGTRAGIDAMRQLIAEGINVNVTLLFSRESYRDTAGAYIDAVQSWTQRYGSAQKLASVASFFVSRIDSELDARISAMLASGRDDSARLEALRGRIAIANAKLAFSDYQELFVENPRWQRLEREFGAQPQRLLWASTGTKNPKYRDVMYVESLIGSPTVNTVPPATLDAFRDHGNAGATLSSGVEEAGQIIAEAEALGLGLKDATAKLLREGLSLFQEADDRLNAALAQKRTQLLQAALPISSERVPSALDEAHRALCQHWQREQSVRQLWLHNARLWTNDGEAEWLDWLHAVEVSRANLQTLRDFADEVRAAGFRAAVLLGMGGSSLGPEVLSQVFGNVAAMPLHVLDSTDPAQIRGLTERLDLPRTLFIVSSKSGGTLEVDLLCRYFLGRVSEAVGAGVAGSQFIAITDPGTKLEIFARAQHFRRVFAGTPKIGGRYSVLSVFGLVPAALIGLDVAALIESAERMRLSCGASVPAAENPGVRMGLLLGVAARSGRNKLTLICAPKLKSIGSWISQLVAESTGKHGFGIVPIDDEPLVATKNYGADRIFVHIRDGVASCPEQDAACAVLAAAGHPVIDFTLQSPQQLAGEFFRWEMAIAVAGSVLAINPFDQPDVEAAKLRTRALLEEGVTSRADDSALWCIEDGVSVHVDPVDLAHLQGAAAEPTLAGAIATSLAQIRPNDYVTLLAFLEMRATYREPLQQIRSKLLNKLRVATCLDFGPRYLHSTGQLYKGGPNSGCFIQITADDLAELSLPNTGESFGQIKAAQAAGDLSVLRSYGRRTLRLHLGKNVDAGLPRLLQAFDEALSNLSNAY